MSNNIKFPIAISKATNFPVHINEVSTGYDCYCFHCNENMVTVNSPKNKVAPHFKHKPNSNCSANFETFIHWLAKELLSKHIDAIELPEITTQNLYAKSDEKSIILDKLFIKYNVPKEFKTKFFKRYVLQKTAEIKRKEYSIEKIFKTERASIKVDFVIENKTTPLFVEPFYSNPIDEDKLRKIELLDVSTIAINLQPFGINRDFDFNLVEFTKYIKGAKSKYWVYLRENKAQKLLAKYQQYLEKDIQNHLNILKEFEKVNIEIDEIQKLMEPLQREMSILRSRIDKKQAIIEAMIKRDKA